MGRAARYHGSLVLSNTRLKRLAPGAGEEVELRSLFPGAMTAIAQQKPDFSGEWTLNRQASALSPAAAAFQSAVMRIDHHEPIFRCQAAYVADGTPVEYTFELRSDRPGLRWDGDALVSTFRTQGPDGEVTISFRYELQEGGRRLQAAEQLRGAGRDQDNVWVFERSGEATAL